MIFLLALVACCSLYTPAVAAEVTVIDDFEYATVDAARTAWEASMGAAPAELTEHDSAGGAKALRLPCPFTREDLERASYDRSVALDLSRAGTITFDFYVDDPTAVSHCNLYFHAGGGWYSASFGATRGWQQVTVGKGAFHLEGQPAGWGAVDTIRISAWKGAAKETWCAFDNLGTRTEDIAVIRGLGDQAENRTAQQCAERLGNLLRDLGVPYGILTDGDVESGALAKQRLAVFAYSPSLSAQAVAEVQAFLERGGKAVFFYTLPAALRESLGVDGLEWRQRERDGEFQRVALTPGALPGAPEYIVQNSWNVNLVQPGGHEARIIGAWQSEEGARMGPALLLSDTGAYLGHILTDGDEENKRALLLALIGHFLPEVWQTAAEAALDRAGRIGPYSTDDELQAFLDAFEKRQPSVKGIRSARQAAEKDRAETERLLEDRKYPEALTAARRVRQSLQQAYFLAHTPRTAEFRAVWNHSGTGDCGTWDEAMKRLQAANFNAVVPNMWWGGVAHYDSKLLPHSSTFDEKGDQIAQCVAAGKKYGIEVHPWKVNWNLSTAPDWFVEEMRKQGRLQQNRNGAEERWLCPSNPANLQLELDTMLEVARNYDVDGLHFDYIRYPHGDVCYCDGCRKRFEEVLGKKVEQWPDDCYSGPLRAAYRDWRCDNITRLVRTTAEEARKLKPYLKLSAAVFRDYPRCRDTVAQDWVKWCREGYLDFVCPMNYTNSDTQLQTQVTNQVSRVGGRVPLYSGIGAWRIPDDQMIGQLEIARQCGADGFILFNMGASLAEQGLPRLAAGITSQPALLPHNAPVIRFTTKYDASEEPLEVEGDRLTVTVELVSFGKHRKQVTAVAGELQLESLTGDPTRTMEPLPLPPVGGKREVALTAATGTVRVVATGTMTYADGSKQPFVVRSRPYRFGGADQG